MPFTDLDTCIVYYYFCFRMQMLEFASSGTCWSWPSSSPDTPGAWARTTPSSWDLLLTEPRLPSTETPSGQSLRSYHQGGRCPRILSLHHLMMNWHYSFTWVRIAFHWCMFYLLVCTRCIVQLWIFVLSFYVYLSKVCLSHWACTHTHTCMP